MKVIVKKKDNTLKKVNYLKNKMKEVDKLPKENGKKHSKQQKKEDLTISLLIFT